MTGTLGLVPQTPRDTAIASTGRTLEEIAATHEAEFGRPPDDMLAFASAYDATTLALEALQNTARMTADGLVVDQRELRSFLESATSNGLTGPLTCDFLGDCGSQAMALVEFDGISETSTLENVVKLFSREP